MIKKIPEIGLIILLIVIIPLYGGDNEKCKFTPKECKKALDDLCIDPDIKSVIGWRRVCNNNKLLLYMCEGTELVSKHQTEEVCSCLENKNETNVNSFFIFEKGFKK